MLKLSIKFIMYQLVFLYLILSFQLNLFDYFYYLKILFGFLALILVIQCIKSKRFFIYFLFFLLSFFLIDIKYSISLIFFFFGYNYAGLNDNKNNFLFNFFLICNGFVMLLQVTGEFKFLSEFQNYYYGDTVSIFDYSNWYPLSQVRPSGIFPSTIYLSYFLLLSIAYILNLERIAQKKILYFSLSISLILSGSTLAFFFILLLILLNFNKFLTTYLLILTFVVLLTFPDYFYSHNFNINEFLLSIESRLYPNIDGTYNSSISKNLYLTIIFVFLGLITFIYKKIYFNKYLLIYILIVFFPLVIHDFGFNIAYAFFLGYLTNLILTNINSTKLKNLINLRSINI